MSVIGVIYLFLADVDSGALVFSVPGQSGLYHLPFVQPRTWDTFTCACATCINSNTYPSLQHLRQSESTLRSGLYPPRQSSVIRIIRLPSCVRACVCVSVFACFIAEDNFSAVSQSLMRFLMDVDFVFHHLDLLVFLLFALCCHCDVAYVTVIGEAESRTERLGGSTPV